MSKANLNEFYDGSNFFSFLTTISGLPIDQVNFLICQFFILVLAYFFRTKLEVGRVGAQVRHVTEVLVGLSLLYFCFGRDLIHVVLQSFICWTMMKVLSVGIMEKVVLGSAVGYLCIAHIYRLVYDYAGFTLDITGPLMLSTQRLSSLAFGLADAENLKKNDKMVDNLKKKVIKKFPNILEFMSYVFSFHGIMCGPFCFYSDYISFIEGTNYKPKLQPPLRPHHIAHSVATTVADGNNFNENKRNILHDNCNDVGDNESYDDRGNGEIKLTNGYKLADYNGNINNNNNDINSNSNNNCSDTNYHQQFKPSPMPEIQRKLMAAALFGASTIILLPKVPISVIKGPDYGAHNFFYKVFLVFLFTALQRQKYYFAWKLGEASNLSAGLGYNGVDEHGKHKWDLIGNVNVIKVEFSTSLKVLIDNWNISTASWLRYIIYDRLHSIVPVFLFSALWHGFYPGYYITFVSGGLFITTSRLMRQLVRPCFQTTPARKCLYDAMTFIASRLAVSYLGLSFLVLEFWPSFQIFREVYFFLHVISLMIALTLLYYKSKLNHNKSNGSVLKNNNNIANNCNGYTVTNGNCNKLNNSNGSIIVTNDNSDVIEIKKIL